MIRMDRGKNVWSSLVSCPGAKVAQLQIGLRPSEVGLQRGPPLMRHRSGTTQPRPVVQKQIIAIETLLESFWLMAMNGLVIGCNRSWLVIMNHRSSHRFFSNFHESVGSVIYNSSSNET